MNAVAWGTLKVAGEESRRYLRAASLRVLVIAAVGGVLLGLAAPALEAKGLHPDRGLYTVEIDRASPLLAAVEADPAFTPILGIRGDFWAGRADLFVNGVQVFFLPASERSRAAAHELELASRAWFENQLRTEPDQDAAYPVHVNVVYEPRTLVGPAPAPATGAPVSTAPGATTAPAAPPLAERPGEKQLGLHPAQVEPPFPIRSLVLAFAYVVPINFIGQLYGGSLLAERTRNRGILLLSAPLTGGRILLGKTLPYLAVLLVLAAGTTVSIHAGAVGFAAVLPVVLFGVAGTAVLGLLARSHRELTFLLVAFTVLLSTFLFLPAIFVEVHPVAFLSPMSVVVAAMRGQALTWGEGLYATVPLTLAGLVLAAVGVALYREETLFAPRRLLSKVVDAAAVLARGRTRLLLAGALAVPFALGLEVFVLIFALTLDLRAAFVFFLVGGAAVEEALKGLVVYARVRRGGDAWLPAGLLTGTGFFLGEKLALLFALAGFGLLPRGDAALATFGIAASPLLVLGPLVLHTVAASLTAYAARHGRDAAALGWMAAVLLHTGYNVLVVASITGAWGP